MPDQFRREARLGAVDLVVDGPERDADRLGVGLEGGVDGGADVADDGAHQVHDLGEQQRAGVLLLGDVLEQGVDGPGVEGVFQGGPGHDGDGALLCEPLEDAVEDHGAASVENHYLPVWRHFSRRITSAAFARADRSLAWWSAWLNGIIVVLSPFVWLLVGWSLEEGVRSIPTPRHSRPAGRLDPRLRDGPTSSLEEPIIAPVGLVRTWEGRC